MSSNKTLEKQASEWRIKKDEIDGFEWTEIPEELDKAIADFHKHALEEKIKAVEEAVVNVVHRCEHNARFSASKEQKATWREVGEDVAVIVEILKQ